MQNFWAAWGVGVSCLVRHTTPQELKGQPQRPSLDIFGEGLPPIIGQQRFMQLTSPSFAMQDS